MFASTSASGWDSPTPGPSNLLDPLFYQHSSNSSIWTPSSKSYNNPVSQPLINSLINPDLCPNQHSAYNNPIALNDTNDSDNSDIEIVEVEKPWNERSPIQLSSAEEDDYDVLIVGTGHVDDEVKTENKKKKSKKHRQDRSKRREKRKRSQDSGQSLNIKIARTLSRSPTLSRARSRSRSFSSSPYIHYDRSPSYQHKKFSYRRQDNESSEERWSPNYHNRCSVAHRSRSGSTDSNRLVLSFTCKDKSRQASSELGENKKKSSKSKKSKRHKSDKEKVRALHKHKSKSKKKKKEKSRRTSRDLGTPSVEIHKHKTTGKSYCYKNSEYYTSDSDSDSNVEVNIESMSDSTPYKRHKSKKLHRQKKVESSFEKESNKVSIPPYTTGNSSEMAVEEITSAQAAVIDQELDSINRALASNEYIGSLFSGNDKSSKDVSDLPKFDMISEPSVMINPNKVLNLKSYKKHPYGHKKSGKRSRNTDVTQRSPIKLKIACTDDADASQNQRKRIKYLQNADESDRDPIRIRLLSSGFNSLEDTIQSSDITSCSDVDNNRQLPSFKTFVEHNSSGSHKTDVKYDSPTSTISAAPRIVSEDSDKDGSSANDLDVVNVETVSNISDADVVDESPLDNEKIGNLSSDARIRITEVSDHSIDVEGSSDSEIEVVDSFPTELQHVTVGDNRYDSKGKENYFNSKHNLNTSEDTSPAHPPDDIIENLDTSNEEIIDVGTGDSDIECSFVEGHKTFEIQEDSDENEITVDRSLRKKNDVVLNLDIVSENEVIKITELENLDSSTDSNDTDKKAVGFVLCSEQESNGAEPNREDDNISNGGNSIHNVSDIESDNDTNNVKKANDISSDNGERNSVQNFNVDACEGNEHSVSAEDSKSNTCVDNFGDSNDIFEHVNDTSGSENDNTNRITDLTEAVDPSLTDVNDNSENVTLFSASGNCKTVSDTSDSGNNPHTLPIECSWPSEPIASTRSSSAWTANPIYETHYTAGASSEFELNMPASPDYLSGDDQLWASEDISSNYSRNTTPSPGTFDPES